MPQPPTIVECLQAAQTAYDAGRFADVEASCTAALRRAPRDLRAWTLRAEGAFAAGRYESAVQWNLRAVNLGGPNVSRYNHLALALDGLGQSTRSAEYFRLALALSPDSAELLNNLGSVRQRQGRRDDARACYRRALELKPGFPPAEANLRSLPGGDSGAAAVAEEFPGTTPDLALLRGEQLQATGFGGAAIEAYLQAAALDPQDAEPLVRLAGIFHQLGRAAEAAELYLRASRLRPSDPVVWNGLGNVYQDLSRFEEALQAYRTALDYAPNFLPAHGNLAYLLNDEGRTDEAIPLLERGCALKPEPLAQLLAATALPPIYESLEELQARRATLERNLERLAGDGFQLNLERTVVPTLFYAAYHGANDRPLHERLASLCRAPQFPATARRDGDARIRVGFVSKYFGNHTIGRLNLGTVRRLDRRRFEAVVISGYTGDDLLSQRFRAAADEFLTLPNDPALARQVLREARLDILFYTDVGMNPLTYTLALSRLAPIQCATWGHPVTTGSPVMDYFISSELLETSAADEHYTERLIRLPDLVVDYERPSLPDRPRTRADFGFDAAEHLYVCPQTLFKLHPDFDVLLREILCGDPRARIVLIEGKYPLWAEKLRTRFSRTIGSESERVSFVGKMPHHEFLALNAAADVLLDPPHFGGGNTTYEALALGVPVVSLPSDFLRGRITQALYRKIGVTDFLAADAEDYVRKALKLGTDPEFRRDASRRITASADVLFGSDAGIRQLESFWEQAVRSR